MTQLENSNLLSSIKRQLGKEGDFSSLSYCADVMLSAADFGKANTKDLLNAGISGELFFQALYSHYGKNKGTGPDVIMGDYYGSVAVIYSNKVVDREVLKTFCLAIQDATRNKDDRHMEMGRLAKIYAASAWVGSYLAGLTGDVLKDFKNIGEKTGLRIMNALGEQDYKNELGKFEKSSEFIRNLPVC